MIYHILSPQSWSEALTNRGYTPDDFAKDGFIHCSDLYQVEKTANEFYHEQPELLVLEIDPKHSLLPLIYENLEGRPHDLSPSLWQPITARRS